MGSFFLIIHHEWRLLGLFHTVHVSTWITFCLIELFLFSCSSWMETCVASFYCVVCPFALNLVVPSRQPSLLWRLLWNYQEVSKASRRSFPSLGFYLGSSNRLRLWPRYLDMGFSHGNLDSLRINSMRLDMHGRAHCQDGPVDIGFVSTIWADVKWA